VTKGHVIGGIREKGKNVFFSSRREIGSRLFSGKRGIHGVCRSEGKDLHSERGEEL